jgi:dienelactone hydrolase
VRASAAIRIRASSRQTRARIVAAALLPTLTAVVVAGARAHGELRRPAADAPGARAAAAESPPACGVAAAGGAQAPAQPATATAPGPFAVGECVLRFVDPSRRIRLPNGRSEPRTLLTYVRYPASGAPGSGEVPGATPAPGGPFPLIVFAHGFAVSPAPYARLLRSWASAGYVVAAPVFPLESAGAPGGPDESDLVNEPTDISFVISRMLAASASAGAGPLAGVLDDARVAVAGQSDGGEAALAAAFSRRYGDRRVKAAVILSGAEMSGVGGYRFAPGGPALLAVQGTADTTNEPRFTYAFFRSARRPKYLLRLIGAQHLPPYTSQQPELGIVERFSASFLDAYVEGRTAPLQRLLAPGGLTPPAALVAEP